MGADDNPALTTWAQVIAEMAKLADDTGYDSRYAITAAYAWIRAGWVPRNTVLKGAAHDGADIGGMALATEPPPTGGNGRHGGGASRYAEVIP